jgi:hypothetical protein
MTPTYPLRLFFDCSTAHLSLETRRDLDARATNGEDLVAATPFGWFVWAEEHRRSDLPDDLSTIMAAARRLGAEYILFDRDAPENDALPVFEE